MLTVQYSRYRRVRLYVIPVPALKFFEKNCSLHLSRSPPPYLPPPPPPPLSYATRLKWFGKHIIHSPYYGILRVTQKSTFGWGEGGGYLRVFQSSIIIPICIYVYVHS